MRRTTWVAAGVVVLATASCSAEAPPAAPDPATTVAVQKGTLSAMVSLDGILTYRHPYPAVNNASGKYTGLPAEGDRIGCGDVFYRVDDEPVLLLCGRVPAYRDLRTGDEGNDVRELNQNVRVPGTRFTARTRKALQALQRGKGADATGELDLGAAVFLPEPVRVTKVTGVLGGDARPGAPVVQATSDTLEVQVTLDAQQQGTVRKGARARITLPGNRSAPGTVDRLGRVAQAQGIPAYVSLDDQARASGLDQAPVQVEITTAGVADALSVPVTALAGRSGGGFAVEVVRPGGRHELVAVDLGLFDTTAGRVQVEGALREGDQVVVPAS